MQKHIFNLNGHLQEIQSDIKPIHEHNAIPLTSTEPMQDKSDSNLDEESLATDDFVKSRDDLEVDNILSNSKVEQQTTEPRTNMIVSALFGC